MTPVGVPNRTIRWWLVGLVAFLFLGLAGAGAWRWSAAPEGPHGFRCPMHPAVVTAGKGTCPTCGMELVERPLDPAAPAGAAAPGGSGPGRSGPARGARYTCPMHPAFVTEDPAVRCPSCGMALVPKDAAPAPPPAPGAPR
jgi:hypothetical protein